jgi:hypothetical protein
MIKSILWSAFLEKTARHLGLVACLCIVFNASDKTHVGKGIVLTLVVGASALHLIGRSVKKEQSKKRFS